MPHVATRAAGLLTVACCKSGGAQLISAEQAGVAGLGTIECRRVVQLCPSGDELGQEGDIAHCCCMSDSRQTMSICCIDRLSVGNIALEGSQCG